MIKTSKQLKDLIRNLSRKRSADAQILLRNYMKDYSKRPNTMPVALAGNRILHILNPKLKKSRIYWMLEKLLLRFRKSWVSQEVLFQV